MWRWVVGETCPVALSNQKREKKREPSLSDSGFLRTVVCIHPWGLSFDRDNISPRKNADHGFLALGSMSAHRRIAGAARFVLSAPEA